MSKSALLDLVTDSRRKLIYHEQDSQRFIESRQDVEPVINAAKEMWSDSPPLDMRRVALIPEEVLNQAFAEGWFHDEAAWKKWANNPDNACYRTCKGSI
ncbi:hypothetical protein K7W03_14420 [Sphingobium sp. PNB]|uniref:hypothetical protein n=1 Tax=Sphingobium sp. PNB TaxID=863934 RepID=UPI001CA41F7F|nr:hypothetical protein [Sphingobium sp. PNB]MCB4860786.1 hypothetical protein [Sphingobium sp. PNB]